MNNRERIVNFMTGKETDRPPFPMWLGFAPWGQTLDRWKEESGISDLNIFEYFEMDPFFTVLQAEYGAFPHFEEKRIEHTDEYTISTDWRGITKRNRNDGGSMPEFLDYPVHNPDEWELYKNERLNSGAAKRLMPYTDQIDRITDQTPVQAGTFPWGVFGSVRDLVGAEELLFGMYDFPDMIRDMMETFTTLWLSLYEKLSEQVHIDHVHIWEDMSGKQGSLISMDMVREFMMPQYDRIAEFCSEKNIPLMSVDSDGLVSELVPVMKEHGVNTFFPFEVQAGNDIREYRREYPDICIMGGLDKNALARTKKEINREIDKASAMLTDGKYIIGFDHLIPPDVPWDNYLYAVTELKRIIG